MGVRERFNQLVAQEKWWKQGGKVLVAVSGGVDSIVLLQLMQELPRELKANVHVAHINHRLRGASEEEAMFVKNLCASWSIPFHQSTWDVGPQIKNNIELAAREYRYGFFSEVMKNEGIPVLLTAHHQDDQVETLMMRLISGTRLTSLVGIEESRAFSTGQLIRPLLVFKKTELYEFAKQERVTYYEDETNQGTAYQRNRLRHIVLPKMKQENPKLNEHLTGFQKELGQALEIVENVVKPLYEESVVFFEDSCQLDITLYQSYSANEQHFLLNRLVADCQSRFQLVIGQRQQELIHQIILNDEPNTIHPLKNEWFFYKKYTKAEISLKKEAAFQVKTAILNLNELIYLSETERLGLYPINYEENIENDNWKKKEWRVEIDATKELLVRKRRAGDRFVMDQSGRRKKVSRYFIDEKISQEEREKSWIVEDDLGHIKCIVPFRESYLSIRDETDKIHYKLVYLYKKDK